MIVTVNRVHGQREKMNLKKELALEIDIVQKLYDELSEKDENKLILLIKHAVAAGIIMDKLNNMQIHATLNEK